MDTSLASIQSKEGRFKGLQTSENFETNKEGAKRTLEVPLKLFAEGREGAMSLFALLVSARSVQYDEKGLWHEFWNRIMRLDQSYCFSSHYTS